MDAKSLPGTLNMAVRTRESISMAVGVLEPLSTGGSTEVVGATPSCKLDLCITGVSCFTGVGCFSSGGFFTGSRQGPGAVCTARTHGGESQRVDILIGVGGNGRPGGYVITDIGVPPCPGNTDDDTTGAANGPAFGTGDPSHGGG